MSAAQCGPVTAARRTEMHIRPYNNIIIQYLNYNGVFELIKLDV